VYEKYKSRTSAIDMGRYHVDGMLNRIDPIGRSIMVVRGMKYEKWRSTLTAMS